jgi:hypothetical protein
MRRFPLSVSLWLPPRSPGESSGPTSWIGRRDRAPSAEDGQERRRAIKRIVEDYHDRHSRTILRDVAMTGRSRATIGPLLGIAGGDGKRTRTSAAGIAQDRS